MAYEEWIEWEAGEMPVAPETQVEVVFGYGLQWDGAARDFDWKEVDGIAMYRLLDLDRQIIRDAA